MDRLSTFHDVQKNVIIDRCLGQEQDIKGVKEGQHKELTGLEKEMNDDLVYKVKVLEGFQRYNELANNRGATKNFNEIEEELKNCEQ